MKDGPARRAVKWIARWKYNVDVFAYRAVQRLRGENRYLLGGDCRRCAKCCEAPGIRVGWAVRHVPMLRGLFLGWQRHVNGFVAAERLPEGRAFVFSCTHFDRETRSCDSYDSRPGMCRDYPRGLLDQAHPEFFPECGYRPVLRNADRLREALDRSNLTPGQKAEMKKKLYLEV